MKCLKSAIGNRQSAIGNRQSAKKGFTLSELLISLAILGLIAGFAIPKVLHSVEEQHKRAVFKETIATIQSLMINGLREGALTGNGSDIGAYIGARIQGQVFYVCNITGVGPPNSCPTIDLPNGVRVLVGQTAADGSLPVMFIIDYNGVRGPNQSGVDRLRLNGCLDTVATCQSQSFTEPNYPIKTGGIGPLSISSGYGGTAANTALYDWAFSK